MNLPQALYRGPDGRLFEHRHNGFVEARLAPLPQSAIDELPEVPPEWLPHLPPVYVPPPPEPFNGALNPLGGLTFDDFVTTDTRRPWAIENVYVDGSKTIIGGLDKDAKSVTALELAVSLASGTPMWNLEQFPVLVEPAPVLYIQPEITDDEVSRRAALVAAGRGLTAVPNLIMLPQHRALGIDVSWDENGSPSRKLIETTVQQAGIRYIIFDPLYELIGDADVSDRSGEVPGILRWLSYLQTLDCTPIITHILGGREFDVRGLFGSKFFRGWLEGVVLTRRREVAGHPDWIDLTVKVSAARFGYGKVQHRLRGTGLGRWELLTRAEKQDTEAKSGGAGELRQRAVELHATGASVPEIATALGRSGRTIERYLAKHQRESAAE